MKFVGQSPCSVNSISMQYVSPSTAQHYIASSTCSDDTAIDVPIKENISSVKSSVTDYFGGNHEKNNIELTNSSSDDIDIDYNSDDNEYFGTPSEKL